MLHSRLFWNLFLGYGSLIVSAVALLGFTLNAQAEKDLLQLLEERLLNEAYIVREIVGEPKGGLSLPASMETRVTFIAKDGRVLVDSAQDPSRLDNHSDRAEVMEAFRDGQGKSIRYSNSVQKELMYVAVRADGTSASAKSEPFVIRISMPTDAVRARLAHFRNLVVTAALLTTALALGVAFWLTRRTVKPVHSLIARAHEIAAGDYGQRVETSGTTEITQLAHTFNHMSERLAAQFKQIDEDRQQLRTILSSMHRLERLRQEFVANVSHELKTPLSIIKACTETLIDGGVDDPAFRGQFLDRIAEQSERLHNLIIDLLRLARVESATEAFTMGEHDLGALAEQSVLRRRSLAEGRRQSLRALPPTDRSPAFIWADEEAIEQILDNLVDNAVKYTPEGGTVEVRWAREADEVVLEVRDTGIGIPEAELSRIFERFYRVDKARSRELGGTGLGLSIVKHLVQAMQGTVEAKSVVGHGSTFTIRFPAVSS